MNYARPFLLSLLLVNPSLAQGERGQPFVLDMVHDNPGEAEQTSAFRNPQNLAAWGYTGQVVQAEANSCETFDVIAPGVLPEGSEARIWIDNQAHYVEQRANKAHKAGIKAYAWTQFVVLPKPILAKFRSEICDAQERIDLERPMTQKLVAAQVNELLDRCPSLDGLVVRTGEIYLHDSPFHASSGTDKQDKTHSASAIINGPQSHLALLKILREEVCVKRGKMLFYRTWDFGNNFHINPDYYLKVTNAIEPHPNLVFSIKHQADDFLRMTRFNPTLGIGQHRQIVEVQCQLEAYGKGAHPYYIGDGVINGWEEHATIMKPGLPKGLRDIVKSPNYAGVWTWTRGGGWRGPYITNELWCSLNAYVLSKFTEDPNRTEEEIFNEFASRQLNLKGEDLSRFRELSLLSAAAILRGQCSYIKDVNRWWARDDTMSAPNLTAFNTPELISAALAEKAEAVDMWRKIERLAQQIQFADTATQDFVETSCAYGRIKYSIFLQGWTVLLYGAEGDRTLRYNRKQIDAAITTYDQLWKEWNELQKGHPSCATLSKDTAPAEKPGLGAAVERYRKILRRTPTEAPAAQQ